jgi:acyl-CoA synthetase (AMP-forming)/AMP-acid ligase II
MQNIAAILTQAMPITGRVLLVYPAGAEYITSFLACLVAGNTIIPCVLNEPEDAYRLLPQLIAEGQVDMLLTCVAWAKPLQQFLKKQRNSLSLLVTDSITKTVESNFLPSSIDVRTLAILNYRQENQALIWEAQRYGDLYRSSQKTIKRIAISKDDCLEIKSTTHALEIFIALHSGCYLNFPGQRFSQTNVRRWC